MKPSEQAIARAKVLYHRRKTGEWYGKMQAMTFSKLQAEKREKTEKVN